MTNPAPDDLAAVISGMLAERGAGKTLCPSEVARAIAGSDETRWRLLMKPIRVEAVKMAGEGLLTIRRKGKVVDPTDFKGVYRLGDAAGTVDAAPTTDAEADGDGAGNSASVRPVSR